MKPLLRFFGSFAGVLSLFGAIGAGGVLAGGDLSQQAPVVVEVRLGSEGGHLAFEPNHLTFETGRLYKLVLVNPSPTKHYFSALRFAAAVWTRKVQDGNMEVKAAVREIEVLPGKRAEWFFVPVQAGVFDLRCTIAGHAEAGMIGRITVR
ncbi:MAG: biphenyl 2,3-dioxygenase [Nitrospinota bacterium]